MTSVIENTNTTEVVTPAMPAVGEFNVKSGNTGVDWGRLLTSLTSVAQLTGRSIYKRVRDNPYEVGGALLGAAAFGLALKGTLQPAGRRKWPWYAGAVATGLGAIASLVKSARLEAKPLPPLDPSSITLKRRGELPNLPAPDVEDIMAKLNAGAAVLGLNMQVNKEQANQLYWTVREFKRTRDKDLFMRRVMDITKGGAIHPEDLEMVMQMPLDPTQATELLGVVANKLRELTDRNARLAAEHSKPISKDEITRLIKARELKKGI